VTNVKPRSVIIIGGGWSGLSAAVNLLKAGYQVTLFESAKQLGGRARCVAFGKHRVDNGQHLLLGAYTQTLSVMDTCGVDINSTLLRKKLNLLVIDKNKQEFNLKLGSLPAPLNIIAAFLSLENIALAARIKTCLFLIKLRLCNFKLKHDISVKSLLQNQPEQLIQQFWEPLCLAALNTSIKDSSAQVFLNVIKDSFTQGPEASDFLIPKVDLANLFVHPAMQYIDQHGGNILLGKKIVKILADKESPSVVDPDGNSYSADHLIIASSPSSTAALLKSSELLKSHQQLLEQFEYEPICTIYLQYPHDISLPQPMVGLSHCTGQWIFDRSFCDQSGLMAVVISASGAHMQLDKMTLAQIISDELSELFGWPDAEKALVIREKRATFKSSVNISASRPSNATSDARIWLCGDYTASPYPATLEAAVQSGLQCSHSIINSL